MKATPTTTQELKLQVVILEAQFQALKTPRLRRDLRLAKEELDLAQAKVAFSKTRSPKNGKRRRGAHLSTLNG